MALEIRRGKAAVPPGSGVIADRRLYLTADRERLVEEGSTEAASLFATPGMEISAADAAQYGLIHAVEEPVPEPSDPVEEAPEEKPARRRGRLRDEG